METNIQTPSLTETVKSSAVAGGRLPRVLGPLMGTALVIGTVIGSGVFRKPSLVADSVPSFGYVALVWIVGGLLALFGALSITEVAVLYPREGGNLVYLREGYGRIWAFLWGWVEICIIRTASIAALATVFAQSLNDVLRECYGYPSNQMFFSYWGERGVTIAVIGALAFVNIRGVKWGGGLQVIITSIKVATLLSILVLPFVLWGRARRGGGPSVIYLCGFGRCHTWRALGLPWMDERYHDLRRDPPTTAQHPHISRRRRWRYHLSLFGRQCGLSCGDSPTRNAPTAPHQAIRNIGRGNRNSRGHRIRPQAFGPHWRRLGIGGANVLGFWSAKR
jgi:Amino acid permease